TLCVCAMSVLLVFNMLSSSRALRLCKSCSSSSLFCNNGRDYKGVGKVSGLGDISLVFLIVIYIYICSD
ncbi:hypothetical protein, partial [Helicobacter bilis]|uniref:hypothetical protein n=1 Tax=Helicobacter bilis TaxID=37372 RepID=UPI0013156196